jgi:MFS family permease
MGSTPLRPLILLGAFSLLLFLITASTFSSLGVVLPHMIGELKWSWASAGLGYTLLGGCCGASSFLPAFLIRKLGVRVTILIGSAVMVGGFACLATTHALPLYFLGCALLGVGYQAMALIPATHVLGMLFKKRALPFGIYFTFGSLGGFAGPWMVLAIMPDNGDQWRLFWTLQAIAAVAVGLLCAVAVGSRAWLAKASAALDAQEAEDAATPQAPSNVYRTTRDWSVAEAVRTPQFYIMLAAYFVHLLGAATVASWSVAHLTQAGVAAGLTAAAAAALGAKMLANESIVSTASRVLGGLIFDRVDPKYLLMGAQAAMALGLWVLAMAGGSVALMWVYFIGTGFGFGATALAVTMLLMNYYGRKNYLEIFSLTCLIGAVSALGPLIAGAMRDHLGSFAPTFQLFAVVSGVVFVAALFMAPPKLKTAAAPAVPQPLADPLAADTLSTELLHKVS